MLRARGGEKHAVEQAERVVPVRMGVATTPGAEAGPPCCSGL